MSSRLLVAFIASTLACLFAPTARSATPTESETFRIDSSDAGIQLQLRNRHPAKQSRFAADRIVLFVHGATFPIASAFDVDLPGGSWMNYIAEQGYDVYGVDVRGYGGSTRPKDAPQFKPNGMVVLYRLDGEKLTKVSEAPIGAWSQGASFSKDGKTLAVQNMIQKNIQVFRNDDGKLTDTGQKIDVGGGAAAIRSSTDR